MDRGTGPVGTVFVREVGTAGFLFDVSVAHGFHMGQLSGFAQLVTPNLAYARIPSPYDDSVCELAFRRSMTNGRREIAIEEEGGCTAFRGMGVAFTGTFVRNLDALYEAGLFDELDLARLYSITGQFYSAISSCFHRISEADSSDNFVAKVLIGAPPGLFTIMEAIVMREEGGALWAAYIDAEKNVVRYFTTEHRYKGKLPSTIENWRERFKEKKVIFDSDIFPTPGIDGI
jgi:hypothetical protein